jgi:hypothetical protein
VADHILTESGDRLKTESGDFLVLAVDLLGEPVYIATAPGHRKSFMAPSPRFAFTAPRPRFTFMAPSPRR